MTSNRVTHAAIGASILIAALTVSTPAAAQTSEGTTTVGVGAGILNFDLSGTGNTAVFTGRVAHALSRHLVVEGNAALAKPEQQFGDSTAVFGEAQLQYQFTIGRVSPYIGGGIGFLRESATEIETDWSPTFSGAVGLRAALGDRTGLFADARLRGVEWDAVGTTAEITGGVTFRLGR